MKNGWLPIKAAYKLGYTGYLTDDHVPTVMLWVNNYGIVLGKIYETQLGLRAVPNQGHGLKVTAFQPPPKGPNSK